MEKKAGFLGVLYGLMQASTRLVLKSTTSPIKVVKTIKKK